tara:strand:- start:138 stop:317 length:180 start_codon:yes stop_codon:yes gene_type:complete
MKESNLFLNTEKSLLVGMKTHNLNSFAAPSLKNYWGHGFANQDYLFLFKKVKSKKYISK